MITARAIGIGAALALAGALPAGADSKDELTQEQHLPDLTAAIAGPATPSGLSPFVAANIAETFYHELAHALIDVLDLPVFGPEEFAADHFAAFMIDRMHDEDELQQMVRAVAHVYASDAQSAGQAAWDLHGFDRQRYFNLVCQIYGADPEARQALADDLELPEDRAVTCAEEHALTAEAWGGVMDGLAPEAPGATGASFTMDWILDPEAPLTIYMENMVARMNAIAVLPETVTISVIPCGEVNAFYDSGPREILICTELGEFLSELEPAPAGGDL